MVNFRRRFINKYIFILFISIVLIIIYGPLHANADQAYIEYFHSPDCHGCVDADKVISRVESDYRLNSNVSIEKIDTDNKDGFDRLKKYNLNQIPVVIINNKTMIPAMYIEEDILRNKIDSYLNGTVPENITSPSIYEVGNPLGGPDNIFGALLLGLTSGFSSCLMAILAFILAYTSSNSENKMDGIRRAAAFALGLVASYIFIGIFILYIKAFIDLNVFFIVAGAVSILIGLYLMMFSEILKMPSSISDKIKELSRKSVNKFSGLFFMGAIFSLVKVPCSAPSLMLILSNITTGDMVNGIITLLTFCTGIIIPFIAIGTLGGYVLAEQVRSYRKYINFISGLIVVIMGILIFI